VPEAVFPTFLHQELGVQLGVDMASNVLKEFWPDLQRKLRHKHRADAEAVR